MGESELEEKEGSSVTKSHKEILELLEEIKEFEREYGLLEIVPEFIEVEEDVVEFAKALALKVVAGMVAGSAFPSSRKITKIIKDRKLPGEVGVIGCGFKTSLWEAVLLNSFFAHASELEDDSFGQGLSGQMHAIFVVKEHFLRAWSQLKKIFIPFDRSYGHMLIMAG